MPVLQETARSWHLVIRRCLWQRRTLQFVDFCFPVEMPPAAVGGRVRVRGAVRARIGISDTEEQWGAMEWLD